MTNTNAYNQIKVKIILKKINLNVKLIVSDGTPVLRQGKLRNWLKEILILHLLLPPFIHRKRL
jgi:hypothetical protein